MWHEIDYTHAREQLLRTLGEMQHYLLRQLDQQATRQAPSSPWATAWQAYRLHNDSPARHQQVFELLPAWAQKQFRQLDCVAAYLRASRAYVHWLGEERDKAYVRGIRAGKQIESEDVEWHTIRNLHLPKEQRRSASIARASRLHNF